MDNTLPSTFHPDFEELPPCGGSLELEVDCSRAHQHGGPDCDGHYIACDGCVDCEVDLPDMDRNPFDILHQMRCSLAELAPALQQALEADPAFADYPVIADVIISYSEEVTDEMVRKVELIERLLGRRNPGF